MKTVSVEVKYAEKASRPELFIRFVWGTLVAISMVIIGMFVGLAVLIQWFYVLLMGKRHRGLHGFATAWLCAWAGMMMYNNLSTDERPPLIPKF